jgi:hypothetical protein
MKKALLILATLLILFAVWYGVWRASMSTDVKRVESSITYQNQQFREKNRWVTLKADAVRPHGFPFKSRVRIVRPTLTFVWGDETYGASFPWLDLEPRDRDSGTYAVEHSPYVNAVYAKSGQAPEEYKVTPKEPLHVLLRAQGDSRECLNLPGSRPCAAVVADAPLISYAVQIPASLAITIELNGETKDVSFQLMALNMPIYQKIPTDMDRPLELLVNILREAMIFKK